MINIVPVKKLIEFRRLSEGRKLTFAKNLQLPKKPKSNDSSGGDYWVRSISGISNAYEYNDNNLIQKKINDVLSVYNSTKVETSKTMYKRNLEILHNYLDFDFSDWRPSTPFKYLANPRLILNIKDIPVQVMPHHVFLFEDKEEPKIGGIWFVTWWDRFTLDDLGIYSEALFRYLSFLYSDKYNIDSNYCIIVDTLGMEIFRHTQILDGKVAPLFESTIDMLVKYLG